ncbi:MAG: hypothetical protein JWP01_1561 [Myxococcales bacterium]|nr:hypothetical protein [Myxococcales bacterium]
MLVATANGASTPTSTSKHGPTAVSVATSCPATYASASGFCKEPLACSYPEGACSCGYPAHCGGMAPDEPKFPPSFQCTPKVRADGCPGTQPTGACKVEGKRCDYTCQCTAYSTCTKGRWVATEGSCKP